MSLLWIQQKTLTIKQNPSPNQNILRTKHAHACLSENKKSTNNIFIKQSIKGTLPGIFVSKTNKGSMTVEAAVLLPLILFFFLNLMSFVEMLRLHGKVEMGLWDIGNDLCKYSYVFQNEEKIEKSSDKKESWWREISDVALSYSYVKTRLVKRLGESYLEACPLTYGIDGLQFLGSDLVENPDIIEMVITYQFSPISELVIFPSFLTENHYYAHAWTGYCIPGTEKKEKQKVYYITDYGEVYHTSTKCTHLDLSVQEVSFVEAIAAKNYYGKKYKKCGTCGKRGLFGNVWITDMGDCYHYVSDCPGLKRTIFTITKKEAEKYRPCSRCGKWEGQE